MNENDKKRCIKTRISDYEDDRTSIQKINDSILLESKNSQLHVSRSDSIVTKNKDAWFEDENDLKEYLNSKQRALSHTEQIQETIDLLENSDF